MRVGNYNFWYKGETKGGNRCRRIRSFAKGFDV